MNGLTNTFPHIVGEDGLKVDLGRFGKTVGGNIDALHTACMDDRLLKK